MTFFLQNSLSLLQRPFSLTTLLTCILVLSMSVNGYSGFNFAEISQLSGQHTTFQSHPQQTSRFSSGSHGLNDTPLYYQVLKEENCQLAAQLIAAKQDLAVER